MAVLIDKRRNVAPKVQQILTKYGCIIETRLGMHEGVGQECSEEGIIILRLSNKQKANELKEKLEAIERVQAKMIELKFDD
nr:hypothetical protein [Sporohalobacter salinus]